MRIALLIIWIACLAVGGYCLGWRHRIVARLSARPGARNVQAPMAYAVMGVTVGLAGVGLIVSGLT